jgi:hypothetical protein
MRRRDFILSCLLLTFGSILERTSTFFKLGSCMADDRPILAGTSPIPEKGNDILESVHNGKVLLKNKLHHSILLNDVGTVIWHYIDGRNSCNDISLILSNEFGIDIETASNDVKSFVFSLKKEGFIDISKAVKVYKVKKVVSKPKPMPTK